MQDDDRLRRRNVEPRLEVIEAREQSDRFLNQPGRRAQGESTAHSIYSVVFGHFSCYASLFMGFLRLGSGICQTHAAWRMEVSGATQDQIAADFILWFVGDGLHLH